MIKNVIDSNDIEVEILTASEMNLFLTNNTVNIKISPNLEAKSFDVTFKNVRSYSEKEINDLLNNTRNKLKANELILSEQISDDMIQMKLAIENIIKDERIAVKVKYVIKKCNR